MKVEVQLRTLAMDLWASTEHKIRYKKDYTITEETAHDLKQCAEVSAMLDARMEAIHHASIP